MFIQSVKIALNALLLNKTRSFLTMLGIVIGITAVIILSSAGAGAQSLILGAVKGIGSNLIFVVPGGTGNNKFAPPASSQGAVITTLVDADVRSLRNKALAPDLAYVSPEARGQFTVARGSDNELALVSGEDENYFTVRDITLSEGDWFTKNDVDGLTQVAILGSKIKDNLFGEEDPINKIIKIHEISFRVIGVMAPKGIGPFGVDQDSQVIVPVSTAQKILLGINYYNLIQIEAVSADAIPAAEDEITAILMNNHRINDPAKNDFTVRNTGDALNLLTTITGTLTLFLAAVAGISLLVGGIGIMNIMLVAVTERTREIGLRKAIGAKRKDILLQFIIEALVLTILGGLFGIVFGIIGSYIIAQFGGWSSAVSINSIILAFGVSALFGIVFGIYPANKASKLDPIDALRYE